MEYIVRGPRAVTLGILPVEVMVVHKCTVEKNAAVGLERARDHVGGIRWRPAVSGRTRPAFGIRLDNKSAEVRNAAIDAVHSLAPPLTEARVERVKRIQAADDLGTAQINRYGDSNAPLAECISDAGDLGQKIFFQKVRIRVDIIDSAAVDPEGS